MTSPAPHPVVHPRNVTSLIQKLPTARQGCNWIAVKKDMQEY